MNDYICYLVTLLQPRVGACPPSLLRVALKVSRRDDEMTGSDVEKRLGMLMSRLPPHCRSMEILEVDNIFEVVDFVEQSRSRDEQSHSKRLHNLLHSAYEFFTGEWEPEDGDRRKYVEDVAAALGIETE